MHANVKTIQTCLIHCHCSLLKHYILVFGIAHVPKDKTGSFEDALYSLSRTVDVFQMKLDAGDI